MELLTKKASPFTRRAVTALLVFACLANALLLYHFIKKQIRIEKYGRSAALGPQAASRVATAEKTAGRVLVLRKGALGEKQIESGGELFGGDRVQTSQRSRATIVLEDKTRLKMKTNSLLVMPEEDKGKTTGESGSVIHLMDGSMEIDSKNAGKYVIALKTPQALIRLNVREVVVFRPHDTEKTGNHGLPYLRFLKNRWLGQGRKTPGEEDGYSTVTALIENASQICSTANRKACSDALYNAWEMVKLYRRKLSEEEGLRMSVSIESDGNENIQVQGGAVVIETANRTLTLAEGDTLELKEGIIPTQPNLTQNALQSLVTRETGAPEEDSDLFPKIESMEWF